MSSRNKTRGNELKYSVNVNSDIGNKKKVNQDALMVKHARTEKMGKVCFACLCDGMGGLSQGEVASAAFINRMGQWFQNEFPSILSREAEASVKAETEELTAYIDSKNYICRLIQNEWEMISRQMNEGLKQYGRGRGFQLGTTAAAIIFLGDEFFAMSVGDSRIYKIDRAGITQISHDHSYVQQQIDMGRMTPQEAAVSPQKSILLQCIGASDNVYPEFYKGTLEKKTSFLLCSDGLWRLLSNEEIKEYVSKKDGIKKMTEIVKARGESDNISGIVIGL